MSTHIPLTLAPALSTKGLTPVPDSPFEVRPVTGYIGADVVFAPGQFLTPTDGAAPVRPVSKEEIR